MKLEWTGVIPAITTPFNEDLRVDHAFLAEHAAWLVESGATGLVPCGSLGEGSTLSGTERRQVIETCVRAVGDRVPIVPGIAALSTADAVQMARDAASLGCRGLMVLPPYAYSTDWREMKAHVGAVLSATQLPCLLYNNPVAYKTDFVPEQIAELARDYESLEAVKESTTDVRRVMAIRALVGARLKVLMGVDDAIVEGLRAGAVGWIAGLVNAFPVESVALCRYVGEGKREAEDLYKWFLPLLRMDTVPKFVQLIKLVQEKVGRGSARVRPPRLLLEGQELQGAVATIEQALRARPRISG